MLDCPAQPEYRGKCLVLGQLDRPCFADSQERPAPLSVNMEECWVGGGRKWEERREGRGGCGRVIK